MDQHPEIRVFGFIYGREGQITFRVTCNGKYHYSCTADQAVSWQTEKQICQGGDCQSEGSQVVNPDSFSGASQTVLGIFETIPPGHILVVKERSTFRDISDDIICHNPGEQVDRETFKSANLLGVGFGLTYEDLSYGPLGIRTVIKYIYNSGGKSETITLGKKGTKQVEKRLRNLQLELSSHISDSLSFELSELTTARKELLALPATAFIEQQIAKVTALIERALSIASEDGGVPAVFPTSDQLELANLRATEIAARVAAMADLLEIEAQTRQLERQNSQQPV